MITKKIKYALKILRILARRYKEEPTFISEIVIQENIPPHYVESILVRFKRSGLVENTVRQGGGYSLLVPADQISFLKVLEIIGTPTASTQCFYTTYSEPCSDCLHEERCTLATTLRKWQAANLSALSKITIQDIL